MGMIRAAFTKYPIGMNSVFYGTLYVSAEFTQQTINRKILIKDSPPQDYDYPSLARYAFIGTCVFGPHRDEGQPTDYDPIMITRFGILGVTIYPAIYYYWYKWLDGRYVGTSRNVIIKKLCLDQFVLSPPILCLFYIGMSLMEGKEDIYEDCRNKFLTTYQKSCMFWIPAQAINFIFVPFTFRIVYIGTCAFAWVNILCLLKRQKN